MMQHWEYLIRWTSENENPEALLNNLGSAGWELVHAHVEKKPRNTWYLYCFFFRRPLEPELAAFSSGPFAAGQAVPEVTINEG